jgi:preprotein translocase subunit YajC
MFISPAYAQAAGGEGFLGGGLVSLLPLVLIFVVFYFLLIRPQQKKAKTHREMVRNVRRGDNILTQGGIIGRVTKVLEADRLMVEIADGVRVKCSASSVQDVLDRSEPAPVSGGRKDKRDKEKGKAVAAKSEAGASDKS